jgi:ribosomal protein S18 acetylase RimI-like enzyme
MTSSPSIEIYPATVLNNPEELRDVLLSAVVNPLTREPVMDEIEDILALVPTTDAEMAKKYTVVAKRAGQDAIIGMMSLKEPDKVIRSFATGSNPVEITNAYASSRQRGIGSALLSHLEDKAQQDGRSEIVLVSGPRFRLSGWPFWRRKYGEPVGIAEHYFEGAYDGMVWRKSLALADRKVPH